MANLQHPDSLHLSAAQGWLALGNPVESALELERIAGPNREHPDVLEMRWQIAVHRKAWVEALELAELLCRRAPESAFGWIHRSYCLHELERTQEAWDSLLPLAEKFPQDWLICYNLACYACQMGRSEEAKSWLERARELGDPIDVNRLASADPDLKPLFQRSSSS